MPHSEFVLRIFALTLAQLVASAISRYVILFGAALPQTPTRTLALAAAVRQDVLVAVAAALITYALGWVRSGRLRPLATAVLTAFACVHCLMLGINVVAVEWLGAPLTVQWIYFADLFRNFTPRVAMETVASVDVLVLFLIFGVAPFWIQAIVRQILRRERQRRLLYPTAVATLVMCLLLGASIAIRPTKGIAMRNSWENPFFAFVSSFFNDVPQLDRRAVAGVEPDPLFPTPPAEKPLLAPGRPPDIVLIVLESVGANAIEAHRRQLPTLDRMLSDGAHFPNAYAATPSSVRSLFSLLVSRYPLMTLQPEISSLRETEFSSLPEALRQQGYRTAFFGGGDFRYRGADNFLKREQVGRLSDLGSIRCAGIPAEQARRRGAAGTSDLCLFSAAAEWARQSKAPYFVTIWSYEGHFPYRSDVAGIEPGSEQAYRLALMEIDRAIGMFKRLLARAGTLQDTIFVIVGDHGEAFGEHGRLIHSTTVFEEEVRVPMIFWGERLTVSGQRERLARLIDVAPSILDIISERPPPGWDGASLFGPMAVKRAFFFTSHRGVQTGFREGRTKFVLDYGTGHHARYKLDEDPGERRPIKLTDSEYARVEAIIAAWRQREMQRYAPE